MFLKISHLHPVLAFFLMAGAALAQGSDEAVRVTVTMNPDGSKTIYNTDAAKHETVATSTTSGGKPSGKIIYHLDAEGRYESGRVFAANGTFRFKTLYRYDGSGRLSEESQLDKNDAVIHKIVYAFDPEGHPTGYAIYDGSGALVGQTTPKLPSSPAAKRHK